MDGEGLEGSDFDAAPRPPEREASTTSADWTPTILPHLVGRVFHATGRPSFGAISGDGQILPNTDGRFGDAFFGSQRGYARYKGYVSFFDLRGRNADDNDLRFDLGKCHPMQLGRHQSFMFLKQSALGSLIPYTVAREEVLYSKLWVPYIECWYPGPVPLGLVEDVLHVTVREPNRYTMDHAEMLHWSRIKRKA